MKFDYPLFLNIHRSLLVRLLFLDSILAVCSVLFLTAPLTVSSISLNNLALLVSIIAGAVFFQMHFYRTGCGDLSYYLMLPVRRTVLIPILVVNSMVPAGIALVLYAGVALFFRTVLRQDFRPTGLLDRMIYVFVVLTIVKVLPLPLAAVYKRHPAMVPAFLLMLGLLYLFLMFIREMISSMLPIGNPAMALLFLAGTVLISALIMTRPTIG